MSYTVWEARQTEHDLIEIRRNGKYDGAIMKITGGWFAFRRGKPISKRELKEKASDAAKLGWRSDRVAFAVALEAGEP